MSFLGVLTTIGSSIVTGLKWVGAAVLMIPTPVKAAVGIAAALIPAGIGIVKVVKRVRESKQLPMNMLERSLTGEDNAGINDIAYTKTVESIGENIGKGNKKIKKHRLFNDISESLNKMTADNESENRAAYAEMRRIRDKRKRQAKQKMREDPLFG